MVKDWKVLGVVEDSEDEDGLDFEGDVPNHALPETFQGRSDLGNGTKLQANQTAPSSITRARIDGASAQLDILRRNQAPAKGIWEIPSSDKEQKPLAKQNHAENAECSATRFDRQSQGDVTPERDLESTQSSPLSSVPSDMDLPSIRDISLFPWREPFDSTPNPLSIELGDGIVGDEVENSVAHSLSTKNSAHSYGGSSSLQNSPSVIRLQPRQLGDTYERSLRPRTLIQQHPYLIENAHYSSALKESGIKPWRIAIESERHNRPRNPQDDEFEDDSQVSAAQIASQDSASHQSAQLEDAPHLSNNSSSPINEWPSVTRDNASNQSNINEDTDNTSVDEQDLPLLEDLLRPPVFGPQRSIRGKLYPPTLGYNKGKRHNAIHGDTAVLAQNDDRNLLLSQPNYLAHDVDSMKRQPNQLIELHHADSDVQQDNDQQDRVLSLSIDEDVATGSESSTGGRSTIGRRIRGVLPASWLRLDEKSGRDQVKKQVIGRHRHRNLDQETRRGVAQRRRNPGDAQPVYIWSDESDDGLQAATEKVMDKAYEQTRLAVEYSTSAKSEAEMLDSSDNSSAMEDDTIDYMMAGQKRQLKITDSLAVRRKRPKVGSKPVAAPNQRLKKQTQITIQMGNSGRSHASSTQSSRHQMKTSRKRQSKRTKATKCTAPHLSILDTIEENAPRFLKIAARTVRRREGKGRSTPRKKSIQLATRQDHIDAFSVLNAWRAGSIRQRSSVSASILAARRATKQEREKQQEPLVETEGNSLPALSRTESSISGRPSQKLVRRVNEGGSITYQPTNTTSKPRATQQLSRLIDNRRPTAKRARPAQLEVHESAERRRVSFHSGKKLLDHVYRGSSLRPPSSNSVQDVQLQLYSQPVARSAIDRDASNVKDILARSGKRFERSRFRKRFQPVHIDIDAPQYSRASDPLPTVVIPEPQADPAKALENRLQGLGPYGTQYTVHFEIFPLDSHVFFHESTLIGSGEILNGIQVNGFTSPGEYRPRITFTLDAQILRWGIWDAQTSSELGIVLDYMADAIERASVNAEDLGLSKTTEAADFILRYVRNSLSFASSGNDAKSFTNKVVEALNGFNKRFALCVQNAQMKDPVKSTLMLNVYDRLILTTHIVLIMCRNDSEFVQEQYQMEILLKNIVKTAVSVLFELGMDRLRDTYDEISTLRFREHGLRCDSPYIHSWVLIIRIMEHSTIPRASFWDIAQDVMAPSSLPEDYQAHDYEALWRDMFALLPLIEFNNAGIVIPGSRHDTHSEGWPLPQKLLKRVFNIYQQNTRQSASFNNYCRALIGRCHYLTQQWGWRRSFGAVGIIFDFFGSQNLAHLRNEDVFKSPAFLEQFDGSSDLNIEPEDRCFHVFLKFLALTIKKLREAGLIKDMRNLIARTIPNHNRQYLREQNVHERDLAALRNHHDLLGTLFISSPPDLRPPPSLLEGLVVPESSHKEACLINLRSWSQLAGFVVASGEATTLATLFKPFNQWRNNFFQKIINQYESVSSDIQQQLTALAKDIHQSVGSDMVDAMISLNKVALMDVMHYSIQASLRVMRQAPELESASHCLNALQMQKVFKRFCMALPEWDWGVLRASLETLSIFLTKIDDFEEAKESQQSESQILVAASSDDALLLIDHGIAEFFFSMARRVLFKQASNDIFPTTRICREACAEEIVTLSARLGSRFINCGLIRLTDIFRSGKYCLFYGSLPKQDISEHRYLVLFVASLLANGCDDVSDAGFSLPELWALSLVRPVEAMKYENRLAEQLHRLGKKFVPRDMDRRLAGIFDPNTRRDLFEYMISAMRCSIRDAGSSLQKILTEEHAKTLKLVMNQIKEDLKSAKEHDRYMAFVHEVISLIKTHGSELCAVDNFFYQTSKEYSPSIHDPQLQVAGLLAYSHRLRDGDSKSNHQLFYLLFHNAKFAIAHDKLKVELEMLGRGMKNIDIAGFILGKMIPAITWAAAKQTAATVLLEVYVRAIKQLVTGQLTAHEFGEKTLPHILVLIQSSFQALDDMATVREPLTSMQLYYVTLLLKLHNLIWPSLYVVMAQDVSTLAWDELSDCLSKASEFIVELKNRLLKARDEAEEPALPGNHLRLQDVGVEVCEDELKTFTNNIEEDIRKSWTVSSTGIKFPMHGVHASRECSVTLRGKEEAVEELVSQTQEWLWWWAKVYGSEQVAWASSMSIL